MKLALRILLVLLVALFVLGPMASCAGTYVASTDGKCNWGRKWNPPQKDASGSWKAGYCSDS